MNREANFGDAIAPIAGFLANCDLPARRPWTNCCKVTLPLSPIAELLARFQNDLLARRFAWANCVNDGVSD